MASRDQHLVRARQNWAMCQRAEPLDKCDHLHWVITYAFYAAVHIVDAVAAADGKHPDDHGLRNKFVRERFGAAWTAYDYLFSVSQDARYDATRTFQEVEVRQALAKLKEISDKATKRLGVPTVG